tara:strand:- start:552 stop:734 length:183 start_codon:yes stop_codon:yes gene_type:complete
MTKERYLYYQNEIQRLKELDAKISARVRSTYHVEPPYHVTHNRIAKEIADIRKNNSIKSW